MAKEALKGKSINLNIVKFGAILILALAIVVYSILLFTGSLGKASPAATKRIATVQEIETAKKKLDGLLSAAFVKGYSEEGSMTLTIKIDTSQWKKLSLKERKTYVTDIGSQMAVTEVSPTIKIIDIKSGMEYASYESNRVTLAELGF
ncbi:MAG: hypothetical protein HQL01_04740 [Nitrospirae bacterium]|nr:hypothetical protein [Nitrospirota bacterium]